MRFKAFRIQNFRSIADTGFQDLSPDNITVIIGQNESGKTSILEALSAIDNDHSTEDDIRNDKSSPAVTCIFQLKIRQLVEIFENEFIISGKLKRVLATLDNCVSIRKTWNSANLEFPILELENKDLAKYFEEMQNKVPKVELDQTDPSTGGSSSAEIVAANSKTKTEIKEEEFLLKIFENTPLITLFKDNSLLPAKIDVASLVNEEEDSEGYIGAKNFLELTGLTLDELSKHQEQERLVSDKIDSANEEISREFQSFWSQFLGNEDKISIQMEIRNYDRNVPLKSGHP